MRSKKFISSLLIFTVLTMSTPPYFKLKAAGNEKTNEPAATVTENKKKTAKIVGEIEDKREATIKRFFLDDFSYEAVVYPQPVHYLENGKWVDVDNQLEEGSDDTVTSQDSTGDSKDSKNILQNKKNDYKIGFAKNSKSNKLVSIKKDNYTLSWNVEGAQKATYDIIQPDDAQVENALKTEADEKVKNGQEYVGLNDEEKVKAKDTLVENEEKKIVKKAVSTLQYDEILPGVDLRYKVISGKLKEDIDVNEYSKDFHISFNIDSKGLSAKLEKDNSVSFFDEKDPSKIIFKTASPFMYDKNGELSNLVDVKLDKSGQDYKLTLTPNDKWMSESNRAYPVTIDPVVSTSLGINDIQDARVVQGMPNTNYQTDSLLTIGASSLSSGINRTYIKFTLPTLKSSEMVTAAVLNLCMYAADYSSTQINVHKVNSNWSSSTLTWANAPGYDSTIEDYSKIYGNAGTYPSWDITSIAKSWYNTGNNFGLLLKNDNETTGYNTFCSSDFITTATYIRPQASIQYISNSGLESYWTYNSQDAGRAGTGYINDYNGNLVFTHNDLSVNGGKMPISINHVYNSSMRYERSALKWPWVGRGWTLNINQWMERRTIGSDVYYVYTDSDGTEHFFKDTGAATLTDELNLGYNLTKEANSEFTLRDNKDNKILFYAGGWLKEVWDTNGNYYKVAADGWKQASNGMWMMTKLSDKSGRTVTLQYNETNATLLSVTDSAGRKAAVFTYDGNDDLSSITYADGGIVSYGYDSNHLLKWAKDIDGRTVNYEYSSSAPYRVTKAYITGTQVNGEVLNVKYGNNSTEYTDGLGRKTYYSFNNSGQTVNIRDQEGHAKYYKYSTDSNVTKMGQESKLQKTVVNYLENHSAEFDNSAWAPNRPTATITSEDRYIGNRSFKVTSTLGNEETYFAQVLHLQKEKAYTFSGYVKTTDVSNNNEAGASLTFSYIDSKGAWQNIRKFIHGTSEWQRYEVTCTIPSDASQTTAWIGVELINSTGTAYFDGLQLEEGSVASRYNLIENGDFTLKDQTTWNPLYWTKNYGTDSGDYVVSDSTGHPQGIDAAAMRIAGSTSAHKGILQDLNISGKSGDVYVLGGWGKSDSVPLRDERLYQLDLGFIKADGSISWKTLHFTPENHDWQYLCDSVVADTDYVKLEFYASYYNNANAALFDGMQLFKEEFGTSYQYDSKGNILSSQDLAKQNSNFAYNGNNDLIKNTDVKGNNFTYEYDNGDTAAKKHNITKATSAENVVYSFSYDSFGNPLTATETGADGTTMQSSSTYSSSGNYLNTLTDSSGNVTTYSYNENTGTLDNVKDAKNTVTTYAYDPNLDRLSSVQKSVDGQTITNSYSYKNDKIDSITHNDFSYNFGYDALGRNTTVSVGSNRNLITNSYDNSTSKLLSSTYGNGQKINYDYDSYDRIVGIRFGDDLDQKFKYEYNAEGNLGRTKDYINNRQYRYYYDLSGRQTRVTDFDINDKIDSNSNEANFGYDLNSNLNVFKERINGAQYATRYSYDKDNKPVYIGYSRDGSSAMEDSLISSYNFENADASDASGNGNNGVVRGTQNFVDNGNSGKAISLNGTDQWVELSDFAVPESFTLSFFAKPDPSPTGAVGNYTFINKNDLAGDKNLFWFGTWGGKYYLQIGSAVLSGGTPINKAGFQHIALTITANSNGTSQVVVYRDGVSVFTGTINAVLRDLKGKKWSLGQEWDGETPSDLYKGQIDEFSVYRGALSSDQINLIYNQSSSLNGINLIYDKIGRLSERSINYSNGAARGKFTTKYSYKQGIDATKTTSVVSSITNGSSKIDYTYDANGNIDTITQDAKTVKYFYNELNELRRENNQILDKTIVYTYDKGGNIQTKTEYPYTTSDTLPSATKLYSYKYEDTVWKDKLTGYTITDYTSNSNKTVVLSYALDSVDGKSSIGNPDSFDGWTLTWENGRQLAAIKNGSYDISFKYNDAGIRTEKQVGTVKTKYRLSGDKVTFEDNGTDRTYYTYDSSGNLVSMNLNGVEYYYIRNAQGDIIGLLDNSGTQIASYTYDSWGKLISIKDQNGTDITNSATSVGYKNPYRYRGYRYDTEIGLYYLNSRYYNPAWGRFINADAIAGQVGELLGHNIFDYCKNNPVNRQDPSGYLAEFNYSRWDDDYTPEYPSVDETIEAIGIIGFTACSIIEAFSGNPGPLESEINRVSNTIQNEVQTTRVGRWMSEAEYSKMVSTGKVQESVTGTTHVALPANIEAFIKQAKPSSIYVEFDVESKLVKPTQEGWGKIVGPSSLEGRLASKKGIPIFEMPNAYNIEVKGTK